jgi:sulfite reductase (ferredoxin)
MTLASRPVKHNGEVGYSLRVGGGLSNEPHLAVRLDAFILPDQAVPVARAVAEIFRDQQVCARAATRTPQVSLHEGGLDRRELPGRTPVAARFHAAPGRARASAQRRLPRPHRHPSAAPAGLSYVGASVLRGRLTGEQLRPPPSLAERFGSGALRPPSRRICCSSIFPTPRLRNWPANWADRPSGRRLFVLARRRRLHRHGVLQAGHH